jgi:hypothetical protein
MKMTYSKLQLFSIFFFVQTTILMSAYYMSGLQKNIVIIGSKQKLNRKSLFDIGTKFQTDKIYTHHYETLYEKYLSRYRDTSMRLLEIGLGCGMSRGVGSSAQTWREYLGHKAELHFIEIDEICGKKWESTTGKEVRTKVVKYIQGLGCIH